MAFQINSSFSKRGKRRIINEINVMPLIDIMLVLLVVFMVTAPMLITGVDVNLPQANSKPLPGTDEPLVVSIDKKGNMYIMETMISQDTLVPKLRAISKEKYDTRIFIRADANLSYGQIMNVMTEISNAGFSQVGLVSQSLNKK
jgi:biopolymer transport protein TolR